MPIGYTECPFCYKDTEVDYEGMGQGEIFKQTCKHCKKVFDVYFELSIEFYSRQGEQ